MIDKEKKMVLEFPKNFPDYELIDTGSGFRLERWGSAVIARPDPQVIWPRHADGAVWESAHAMFEQAAKGERGAWRFKMPLPVPWTVKYRDVKFLLKPTPFKHVGLFAEQAANWEWMINKLKFKNQNEKLKVLNLFAYTGGATIVLTGLGHFVTHVDASKPAIVWAKENQAVNGFTTDSVRWILDDVVKFVRREVRRGAKYDGIIMDPPAFGHGPTGRVWKFNEDLPGLLSDCVQLLSSQARFLLVNGYATNSSALALGNLVEDVFDKKPGMIESGELTLRQTSGRLTSTGIFSRWSVEK